MDRCTYDLIVWNDIHNVTQKEMTDEINDVFDEYDGDMHRNCNLPPFWGGAESPSNTKLPGLRTISMPSAILIHPAVWTQQTWAENWGLLSLSGEGS